MSEQDAIWYTGIIKSKSCFLGVLDGVYMLCSVLIVNSQQILPFQVTGACLKNVESIFVHFDCVAENVSFQKSEID